MVTLTQTTPADLARAALTLFSERGIDGVNLDAVAAAAGVTKGSLYWHFPSKKAVILAACEQYYTRWRASIDAAMAAQERSYDKLQAAVIYSVRSCLLDDANRVFTTEIVAQSLYDAEIRASWAGFLDEVDRLFLGLTHRAVGAGELANPEVDRSVDVMLAAMEGIKQKALFRPGSCARTSEAQTIDRLLALLGVPL